MAKKVISDEQMKIISRYCYLLSLVVSPNDAAKVGLNFDGSVCDFLKDLSMAFHNNESFNLWGDSFYKPVFEKMRKDIRELD